MGKADYRLIRSGRKTIALSMDRQGSLTVRAPQNVPQARIDAFVVEKRGWIDRTRVRMAELPKVETLALQDGALIPFLGDTLILRLCGTRRVTRRGCELLTPQSADTPVPVVRWLEARARVELAARAARWSQALTLPYQQFRLSRARGRWGSMSARGTLSLNRALILCPPDVVDYVIVHELCHLPPPRPSPAFWALVERLMPAYRGRRDWLKAHGSLIRFLPD
jgi:predicted metal-dependent hydrolase